MWAWKEIIGSVGWLLWLTHFLDFSLANHVRSWGFAKRSIGRTIGKSALEGERSRSIFFDLSRRERGFQGFLVFSGVSSVSTAPFLGVSSAGC